MLHGKKANNMPRCTQRASPARHIEQLCPSLGLHRLQSRVRLQLHVSCSSTDPWPHTTQRSRRQQKPTLPGQEGQGSHEPLLPHLPGAHTGMPRARACSQRCLSPKHPGKQLSARACFQQRLPGCSSSKALVPAHGIVRFLLTRLEGDFSTLPPPSRNPLGKQDSFSTATSSLKSHLQVL